MMKNPPFKIAIIGFGPKGLYGFERILAQLNANRVEQEVEIHLFNKTSFMGSGDVYRSDQPAFLLMNFPNKHINMWTEEAPPAVVRYPLSLSEFLTKKKQISFDLINSQYVSRATVGDYLEKGFNQLCQNLPENVSIQQHIAEVRSIEKIGCSYTIGFIQHGETYKLKDFKNMLICTGHQRHKTMIRDSQNLVPFIYPVEEKLKKITENQTVAIKGMGLTFIDAALALTEGRGGVFTEAVDGKLTYNATGKEPKRIFPFSKSGWPMMPKYSFKEEVANLFIETLLPLNHKQLSFKNDILPLITQDMECAYYRTLFSHEKEQLKFHRNYHEINRQIDNFHQKHPKYERFSLERLLEPEFNPVKSIHQNILANLAAFTKENNLNIVNSALLNAAALWRKMSPIFNKIYSFSGLNATSHLVFDHYYFGKLNRIAFGPPAVNLKKILALAEAGIIDFQFAKNPKIAPEEDGYNLSNEAFEIHADMLIDARIPKNSMEKESTGLFTNLCLNGLARPYENKDEFISYLPGIAEINRNGNLINWRGVSENITLYGTPTEGMVHDNDTLSRTKNNFCGPWAKEVVQQIMNRKNATKQQAAQAFSFIK